MKPLEKAEKIYRKAVKSRGISLIFMEKSMKAFASLSENELAVLKRKIKKKFGEKLNLNDFTKCVNKAKIDAGSNPEGNGPVFIINKQQLPDSTNEVIDALKKQNDPPYMFKMGGNLVRLESDEIVGPVLMGMTIDALRGEVARLGGFYRQTAAGLKSSPPSIDVIRDIMSLASLPFPRLDGIVEAPVLRPDGSILDVPGYDAETFLYYAPAPDLRVPKIPKKPSKNDLKKAIALLMKPIRQLPIPGKPSCANTLGLMLTPIIRPAITGPVPLAVIDAPTKGTGKSLLANIVTGIAQGKEATLFVPPKDDDEWRKKITTVLKEGASLIFIDDAEVLESSYISTLLTSLVWEDRILGVNKSIRVPNRTIWMAAGNNIFVMGDLQRRCFWIRMNAKTSEPWLRTDFEIPDLHGWVAKKRGKLIAALLIIARAWFVAGKPMAEVPVFGGFEKWSSMVGSILAHAGISGFLENLNLYRSRKDEESLQWEGFLQAWSEHYAGPVTVHKVCSDIREKGPLREALPGDLVEILENPDKSFERVLGKALAKKEDVRFGKDELRLKRTGEQKRAILWKVLKTEKK